MSDSHTIQAARGGRSPSPVVAKWGEAINAGFQIVPDVLLKHQSHLDLSATDLVVLLNLTMHWWLPERHPYPRSTTIARRMNVSARTVQRSLNRLSELGLIERARNESNRDSDYPSTVVRLTGLARKLEALAVKDGAYRARDGVLPGRTVGQQTG